MLKKLSLIIVLVIVGGLLIYKGVGLKKKPAASTTVPTVTQEEKNITVEQPAADTVVSSPITVKGSARVFENVVSLELTDNNGTVLFEGTAMASAPDVGKFGPYEKEIEFKTNAPSGTLTIYQASAKDGSRIDVVTIPLKFK